MKEFSPMLASPYEKSTRMFPALVSPKLDGIRCCIVNGQALTRSLKPIPNRYIRECLSLPELSGLDGEIIVGSANDHDVYNRTNSAVMSHDGIPAFTFFVFDYFEQPEAKFSDRLDVAHEIILSARVNNVLHLAHYQVQGEDSLIMMEEMWLRDGFEGIMVRRKDAPYKYGRATPKSGDLIKKKNFTDGEFEITGFEELMHNDNEAFTNELGRTARSKSQHNLRGGGVLGAFLGKDLETGAPFRIGTGFDAKFREWAWQHREELLGAIGKHKSFKIGVKDAPRHPVWLGFRDKRDMS